jgi:hypothetical protein
MKTSALGPGLLSSFLLPCTFSFRLIWHSSLATAESISLKLYYASRTWTVFHCKELHTEQLLIGRIASLALFL